MKLTRQLVAVLAVGFLGFTGASAYSASESTSVDEYGATDTHIRNAFIVDYSDSIISEYEITGASSIEEGVMQILGSVKNYGAEEYNKQVEDGVEQPFFWLAKPLNLSADNPVDMFAPDFTRSINMGACFEMYFHQNMQSGMSPSEAASDAKQKIPVCLQNGESPLEGKFASKVRQMVLCHPLHGQLLLDEADKLPFAAAMPCHLSIYNKEGKIMVSWRNVEEMAKKAQMDKDSQDLAKEVQENMEEMLSHL